MSRAFIAQIAALFLFVSGAMTETLALVPWPTKVQERAGMLEISGNTVIEYNAQWLLTSAQILSDEIFELTKLRLAIKQTTANGLGNIILSAQSGFAPEGYKVDINDRATIKATSARGFSWGAVTLLQIAQMHNNKPVFKKVYIEDQPVENYRGVLLDIAREPFSLDSIKRQIILNRFYKVPFLVLHLTDDQAVTFKLDSEPTLGTTNENGARDYRPIPAYTRQELEDLVKFANARGVTLIPEFDMPGHGAALIRARPDLFKTGAYHHATLNIANDAAVQKIQEIVKELANIFKSSPYFHLGGDEADFSQLHRNVDAPEWVYPNVREQWNQKLDQITLEERAKGRIGPDVTLDDAHVVYRKFLNDMNSFVKKLNKKALVWESFTILDSIVPVARDIVVLPYDQFVTATTYIDGGFSLINSSWSPLYIVHASLADGSDGLMDTESSIYRWNKSIFDVYYDNRTPTSAHIVDRARSVRIRGAQMSLFECTEGGYFNAERPRLPAMSEKLWNPRAQKTFDDFIERYTKVNEMLDVIIAAHIPMHSF